MAADKGGLRSRGSVTAGGAGCTPMQEYKILNNEADVLFEGDLVVMEATGTVTVNSAVGEVGVVGVFAGCEYTNADGQRVWSNKYNTQIARDDTVAFVYSDPFQTYTIAIGTADANTTLTMASIGASFDLEINAGDAQTGMSGMILDSASTPATTGQVRIVGLTNEDGTNDSQGDHTTKTFSHAIVQIDPATHFSLGIGVA